MSHIKVFEPVFQLLYCIKYPTFFTQILSCNHYNEMGGACSTYGGEERRVPGFGGEREHLGDPGLDGRIILRWIFRKWDVGVWTGSSWLRIGTGGGQL